jgi:hypothetical protein
MRKEESAHFGQKIRTETGPDRSSFMKNDSEALVGRSFKGGPRDLSHSLSGTSVQNYNDVPAKKR